MLDQHYLRQNTQQVAEQLKKRGYTLDIEKISQLEQRRKQLQVETQSLQNERNSGSKAIGQAKRNGEDAEPLMAKMNLVNQQLKTCETQLAELQQELQAINLLMPNLPHESVPEGKNEEQNIEVRKHGEPTQFDFTPKDHVDLAVEPGWMDFDTASKLAGSRFVVLKGALARLHRALIQLMLQIHTEEHGYEEVYVPYLANAESLLGSSQLPHLANDLFTMQGEQPLYLIPTAEVPLTNLVRDKILPEKQLPIQYVAHTPCFRREAGSYGKDTRGMIRQHQFEKVELVWICKPEESYQLLEKLTGHAEAILQRLGLPYRVMALCTGDLGFAATKTYDLEVWLPSQKCYREISSCSNTESFQARRMQARFRSEQEGKPQLVHTLNGSGLAIGRTLLAILENYQDAQGKIHLPECLHQYMGGVKVIHP